MISKWHKIVSILNEFVVPPDVTDPRKIEKLKNQNERDQIVFQLGPAKALVAMGHAAVIGAINRKAKQEIDQRSRTLPQRNRQAAMIRLKINAYNQAISYLRASVGGINDSKNPENSSIAINSSIKRYQSKIDSLNRQLANA